jgi:2'-5' RNA ligase
MSAAERLRLFVALEVPPKARDAIEEVAARWRPTLTEFRWSLPQDLHMTLAFLGAVDAKDLQEIQKSLTTAAEQISPFATRLAGLGRFPHQGRARVLWVGLDDAEMRIAQLAAAVRTSLEGWLELGDRPMKAHVTIARGHPHAQVPAALLEDRPVAVGFLVHDITLFRSHVGTGPPRYEVLARRELGARAAELP